MVNIFRVNTGWMYSLCWTDVMEWSVVFDGWSTHWPKQWISIHLESNDRERHCRDSDDLHQLASVQDNLITGDNMSHACISLVAIITHGMIVTAVAACVLSAKLIWC